MRTHHFLKGKWGIGALIFLAIAGIASLTKAGVPNEYIANYEIKKPWDTMIGSFVEIEAMSKIGQKIETKKFVELQAAFAVLFPKLPQDYSYTVVYAQCNSIVGNLALNNKPESNMVLFMGNCYKPLSDILKKITTTSTIIPKAKANPTSGPAPLTVSFDARGSVDPSNETIPSGKFYWYYRDIDGQDKVIGNGPVVNYTFENAGNYLVHLTVKSSNKAKGILDGESTLSIDVAPKSALITVYANGQKLTKDKKIKIGTQEAERGIVFDASATLAMGGRKFLTHTRTISSKDGFNFTKDADGKPDVIRVQLPGRGEYKVELTTNDNEGNKVTESYELVASDPIAIIKQSPEVGNTSSTFAFDASASYSVLSALKLYTREIYNQNGDKIETYQGKDIKQQFKKPGSYTVKLTIEDELGQTNIDSMQVYVESTDPIPQFTVQPTNERQYPSRFLLDATISSDIDKTNGFDVLKYEWIFPDEAKAKIVDTQLDNGKIVVEFNATGKFKYKLIVKDNFGKLAELEKEIEVKSILRPEFTVNPTAATWGSDMTFSVVTNEPILTYDWDFGDGDKRTIQTDKITHQYKKTGIYKAKLTVYGGNETTNQIGRTVFVGEKGFPIAGYQVIDKTSNILTQNESCTEKNTDGTTSEYPAYQIDRYKDFVINPNDSVNSKGDKTDLQFFFQPKNGEIYKQTDFSYKFNDMGCQFIELTAEDTSIAKNNKTKIWFKVVNALPKLDNVVLFFPQYGNEIGIGFNQNQVRDIFNDSFDPLIVKVTATNSLDADGFVSYYKWYYYLKDDPTRFLETKITPGDIPYAFFSLPRIPGEYMFGVTMYDNDEGKQTSEQLIGKGPLVFFPPDASRPDVPLVTLKMDQTSVEVGDEITFDVVSKVISDRPDFLRERTIYYDFDGDGERDLVTKDDHVKHSYDKPSDANGYRPRASVLYRGYRGVSQGGTIVVKNGLKPRLLYSVVGKTVLVKDISLGDVSSKEICFDMKNCNEKTKVNTGVAFTYTYPDYGKYFISMNVRDEFANESKKVLAIEIPKPSSTKDGSNQKDFLAIPEPEAGTGNDIEFYVGNALDNSILWYIPYDTSASTAGQCYVDTDISLDMNSDGNLANDKDVPCNQMMIQKFDPKVQPQKARWYYTAPNGTLLTKDISINFIDVAVVLDPETQLVYDKLDTLLSSLSSAERNTGAQKTLRDSLVTLRDNLQDKVATASNVVSAKDYLERGQITLTPMQDQQLKDIFVALSTKAIAAAEGAGDYGKAKAEIIDALPAAIQLEVSALFTQFESAVASAPSADQTNTSLSQQDKRKDILNKIVALIEKNIAPDGQTPTSLQIEKVDMDAIIIPNMCKIMASYNIPSATCNTDTSKAVPENIVSENKITPSTGMSWVKIIFIILGIVVVAFIGLVAVFAVRAKIAQEKEDNPEEVVAPTPSASQLQVAQTLPPPPQTTPSA